MCSGILLVSQGLQSLQRVGLQDRGHILFRQDAKVELRVSVASLTSSDKNETVGGRAAGHSSRCTQRVQQIND